MGKSDTVGKKLNGLLKKNQELEKGFEHAMEFAKSAALKRYFSEKAIEVHGFVQELRNEIVELDAEISKNGTPAGTWYSAWMDLNALGTAKNDESMLEEALTGKKMALEEYDQMLKEAPLPPRTLNLLRQQREKISWDLATIKKLDDVL